MAKRARLDDAWDAPSSICDLPPQLQGLVFSYLDPKSLLQLRATCANLKAAVSNNTKTNFFQVFEADVRKMQRVFPQATIHPISHMTVTEIEPQVNGDYKVIRLNYIKATNQLVESRKVASFFIEKFTGYPLHVCFKRIGFVRNGKLVYSKSCLLSETGKLELEVYRNHYADKAMARKNKHEPYEWIDKSSFEFTLVCDIPIPQVK